jgi:GT2 family glycosyltransferase
VIIPTPQTPKISVIIPCYNLGQYLDEAVESVLSQTYQDFEILIVDDGSTDPQTQALLQNYLRPKTRVIQTAHAGLAAARNLAIAKTTGAYLCALDADDRLEPTYFEKAVPVLEANPSFTFVSCWLRAFGDEEWDWKPERCDLPALLCEDTVCTAALVRREAVLAVGAYDTTMPLQGDEDWDLWLTLVEHGYQGVILPEPLFHYRQRAGSMSAQSWYGPGHLPLAGYRVAKHSESYRAHVFDVFLHQDAETARLLRRNDELERQITSELEPALVARHEHLETLRARLGTTRAAVDETSASTAARIEALESALLVTAAEVRALRTSMSWRVTAPLRAAYGWWLRWRRPA